MQLVPHMSLLVQLCELSLGSRKELEPRRREEDCWKRTLDAAIQHGLIGTLREVIQQTCEFPDLLGYANDAYLAKASRNLELTSALTEILAACRSAGVEVAVLKGPALALLAYGNIAQREFTDLDLLVRPADIARTCEILNSVGYRKQSTAAPKRDREKHFQFVRSIDSILIELHWLLNPPLRRFPLESTGLWNRRKDIYFHAQPIPTLNTEDTFLALSIHGTVHGWTCLKWIYDIATLMQMRKGQLAWRVLLARAESAGCVRALLVASQLASSLFTLHLQSTVASRVSADRAIHGIADGIKASILDSKRLSPAELVSYHVRVHDRLMDRLYVAYHYWPDSDEMRTRPLQYITDRLLRVNTVKQVCYSVLGL